MLALFLACTEPESASGPHGGNDSATDSGTPDTDTPSDTDTPTDTDTPPDTGADAFSQMLVATTDLCKYEDGEVVEAELEPAPDGYIELWPSIYIPCLDGLVYITRRVLDYKPGRLEDADAVATFFTIDRADQEWMQGQWLDEPTGTDDCGLARTTRSGLATDDKLVWLDPGAVTLDTPDGATSMDRQPGGFVLNWGLDLTKVIVSDEEFSYGLDVAGSAGTGKWGPFDAIDLPDLVTLPSRLEVTSPSPLGPGVELSRKDTALEWTGTSDGLVAIRLAGSTPDHLFELQCTVTDDGSFTIPGDLIDLLPHDIVMWLLISRLNDVWVGTTHGRSFHAVGRSSHEVWDLVVP